MAKLVILNQGLTGRMHELNVERTTVGRVEDNLFQIAEASVSSHHCEIQVRGSEILIRDLNSTNGTFINGEKITESFLKPGQTLRLGNVELKLESEAAAAVAPASAPAAGPAPAKAPAPGPTKRPGESNMSIPRGVSLSDLESGGRPPSTGTTTAFTKKRNKAGMYFWIAAGIVGIIIVVLLLMLISQVHTPNK